jgi:uncharacterized RDD family membrane protein YckC
MTPEIQALYCSECGRPTPPEEMARFGDRMICGSCKNAYAQKLREGAAPAGTVHYGGFWWRFLAVMIDGIILAIPMGILQGVLFAGMGASIARNTPNPNATPGEVFATLAPFFGMMGLAWVINLVISCAYETFFIVKFAATPGKMAVGVQVLRPDGSKLHVGRAIGRHFSKMVSWITLGIGYIMAGFDSQKRALHDIMCDTRVFKTRG